MSWFLNHYRCARCHRAWADEWSCMCDDDCPHCGFRHMTPERSDDLTEIVVEQRGAFVVLRAAENAEHDPDYSEVARFASRAEAEARVCGVQSPI